MAKLINKRFYLDYNATSPLADSVKSWIADGDFFLANPSSNHASGKASRRLINETRDYLLDLFQLPSHKVFFHSGATEGINTIFKSLAEDHKDLDFFYFATDHSCVVKIAEYFKLKGHQCHQLDINKDGKFDIEEIINKIKKAKGTSLLNWTYINNETGIVFDLTDAARIKEETGAIVHVDAVQAVGKVKDWNELNSALDFYSFSGHKFGSLKGVGFSFYHSEIPIQPLLIGGGQQKGLRSGTENVSGVYSMLLALKELVSEFDSDKIETAKSFMEEALLSLINEKGAVVGREVQRNLTTIFFYIKGVKASNLSMALDLAGIDVSNGSACASGAVISNRIMKAMGYDDDISKSVIRLSTCPRMDLEYAKKCWKELEVVLKRFL